MYKVLGLRVEKYLGQTCTGHNCDFEYGTEERDRHVLLLKQIYTSNYYELTLSYEEDSCGSGWCTASYGVWHLEEVKSFAGKTHDVIHDIVVSLEPEDDEYDKVVVNDVFRFTENGGDPYYPSGRYSVNMELFRPCND